MPETPPPSAESLHALLDRYLRCPSEPLRGELNAALTAFQTAWIHARAGQDAPTAPPPTPAAPKRAPAKPKFPIAAADLAVLEKMAEGWVPTAAEVPRWVWFENRELVTMEPNPAGSGPEVMRLAPAGWAALGRPPG
ncbi:hypothetical protein FBZ83_107200 [Azospirillum brasilense]|uniref:Uncharacterized protein n=1 Tax=Azospirillum brasilense TaxID=192 RepID=A0A560CCD4_AZOBR|nr:hypothetical protein [Azospirillum brasilense]TWA82512.1 hypothetical protein FBZ83_107200 [Azospirillum brasilense]